MASLPNLDTDGIGMIGFWNFLDYSTDTELDPTEALSDDSVASWEAYDNGVQGEYDTGESGRHLQFRIKADGWFIAWYDRTHEWENSSTLGRYAYGYWNILINNNHRDSGTSLLPDNTFRLCFDDLKDNLSNGATATLNAADMGLYCYEYPTANTISSATEAGRNTELNGALSYSPNVTRLYHVAYGGAYSSWSGWESRASFNGFQFATGGGGSHWEGVDVLADNLMPSSGTVYRNRGYARHDYNTRGLAKVDHLMLYSV